MVLRTFCMHKCFSQSDSLMKKKKKNQMYEKKTKIDQLKYTTDSRNEVQTLN